MEYSINNIKVNIIEDRSLLDIINDCSFFFEGAVFNKSYKKTYKKYIGTDFINNNESIPYLNEFKSLVIDLETGSPDTDIDFLIEDSSFEINDLFESALILGFIINSNKYSILPIELTFNCKHPMSFFILLELALLVDSNSPEKFIEETIEDYFTINDVISKAFLRLQAYNTKKEPIFTDKTYKELSICMDDLFNRPLVSTVIDSYLEKSSY